VDLPTIIPIFALPNVVLFPGVPLPLHIFEPRYRDMVRDASAGPEIIGLSLLRGSWREQYEARPEIFEIGCAAKIINVDAASDGTFDIVLHGMREFAIRRHIFAKSYRQAEVTWRSSGERALPAERRARLTRLLSRFLEAAPDSPAQRLLDDGFLTDELLVHFFSFAVDIVPLEKQALLEARTLPERAERLAEVLEFHLEEARLGLKSSGPDRCH